MRLTQALELQAYAEIMNVKLDVRSVTKDNYAVQFHRVRTDDFNRAAMQLRHYEMTAIPESHAHLVG